jgi:hypothetical protein
MLSTESTQELDTLLDRMRAIKGVKETASTLLLSSKLERPGTTSSRPGRARPTTGCTCVESRVLDGLSTGR